VSDRDAELKLCTLPKFVSQGLPSGTQFSRADDICPYLKPQQTLAPGEIGIFF